SRRPGSRRRSSRRRRSRSRVTFRAPTSTAPFRRCTRPSSLARSARIGVVGATGAVGTVTLELLRERGYPNVRAFASARSAGKQLGELRVEEATAEALSAGDLDVCLFSVGTAASRELVPHAVRGGAIA